MAAVLPWARSNPDPEHSRARSISEPGVCLLVCGCEHVSREKTQRGKPQRSLLTATSFGIGRPVRRCAVEFHCASGIDAAYPEVNGKVYPVSGNYHPSWILVTGMLCRTGYRDQASDDASVSLIHSRGRFIAHARLAKVNHAGLALNQKQKR